MRARLAGVLILGGAVLAVVVAPNLGPGAVIGTPVHALVAGPPALGACVLNPGTAPWDPLSATPDVAVAGTRSYSYPRLPLASCVGARYGEVVSIIPHPVKPVVTVNADGGTYVTDPNLDSCQIAAWRYIGLATQTVRAGPISTFWYPVPMTGTAATSPTVRQQAAGQHWLACIAFPRHAADLGGGMTDPPGHYGSALQGALLSGADRDRLGSCWSGINLAVGDSASCTDAHQGELFGYGSIGNKSINRSELQKSCGALIARLTRLSDITDGGALVIQLQVTSNSDEHVIHAVQIPSESSAVCGLVTTGHRHLRGSLLALGNSPVPWA